MLPRLPILLCSLLTVTAAVGQKPDGGIPTSPLKKPTPEEMELLDDKAQQLDGDHFERFDPDSGKMLPPEEKLRPISGLERYVSAVASMKPSRIAPGETGTLNIVLALQRGSVLEADAHLVLTYPEQQGSLTLGGWEISQPNIGKLPTKFQGSPVYDNTGVITIPVTAASSAEWGDQVVMVNVEADVTNDDAGMVHGRYTMSVRPKVTIGASVPRPNVRTKPRGGGATAAQSGGTTDLVAADPDAERSAPRGGSPIAGTSSPVAAASAPADFDGPVGVVPPPVPPTQSMWIFIAGGGLLLAIALLAVFGRKR